MRKFSLAEKRGDIEGNVLAGNLPSCVFSAGSILREGKPFPQIRLGVTYSRVNLRDILTT